MEIQLDFKIPKPTQKTKNIGPFDSQQVLILAALLAVGVFSVGLYFEIILLGIVALAVLLTAVFWRWRPSNIGWKRRVDFADLEKRDKWSREPDEPDVREEERTATVQTLLAVALLVLMIWGLLSCSGSKNGVIQKLLV